jgi:hypothetical protein
MHKISKSEAHHSVGHRTSHCGPSFEGDTGYCRYFHHPTIVNKSNSAHASRSKAQSTKFTGAGCLLGAALINHATLFVAVLNENYVK